MMSLSASNRKMIYAGLWVLDGVAVALASQHVLNMSPPVVYCVLSASAFLSAFMHAWSAPDAPVMPALLQAAPALLEKPAAPKDGAK